MREGKDDCWINSIVVSRSFGEMRITADIGLFDIEIKRLPSPTSQEHMIVWKTDNSTLYKFITLDTFLEELM